MTDKSNQTARVELEPTKSTLTVAFSAWPENHRKCRKWSKSAARKRPPRASISSVQAWPGQSDHLRESYDVLAGSNVDGYIYIYVVPLDVTSAAMSVDFVGSERSIVLLTPNLHAVHAQLFKYRHTIVQDRYTSIPNAPNAPRTAFHQGTYTSG